MAQPVYSGPWRRIRLKILERDGYICQVKGRRCKGVADRVDHIVPVLQGGAWWDENNLRASCDPCNRDRVNGHGNDRWKRSAAQNVLVVGPPGAGKTTYVRDHKQPSDLVVDYDAIAEALGSDATHGHDDVIHRSVMAARNAVLNSLRRGECEARRAWIISANPKAESIFPFHERVVVDPGREETLHRGSDADRPASWMRLVDDWYATRSGSQARPKEYRAW